MHHYTASKAEHSLSEVATRGLDISMDDYYFRILSRAITVSTNAEKKRRRIKLFVYLITCAQLTIGEFYGISSSYVTPTRLEEAWVGTLHIYIYLSLHT